MKLKLLRLFDGNGWIRNKESLYIDRSDLYDSEFFQFGTDNPDSTGSDWDDLYTILSDSDNSYSIFFFRFCFFFAFCSFWMAFSFAFGGCSFVCGSFGSDSTKQQFNWLFLSTGRVAHGPIEKCPFSACSVCEPSANLTCKRDRIIATLKLLKTDVGHKHTRAQSERPAKASCAFHVVPRSIVIEWLISPLPLHVDADYEIASSSKVCLQISCNSLSIRIFVELNWRMWRRRRRRLCRR